MAEQTKAAQEELSAIGKSPGVGKDTGEREPLSLAKMAGWQPGAWLLTHAVLGPQRASEGGDDASADRRLEAERIADCDDQLPNAQRARVAERCKGQADVGVDAEERQVGGDIAPPHGRV